MTTICMSIQELLAATGGVTSELTPEQRAHVDGCAECRAAALAERRLEELFEAALPPVDPAFEGAVLTAIGARRRWRRVMAALPIAASLLITLAGSVLLGGVPGGGLLAQLPAWTSRGWLALAAAGRDWVIAVNAVSRAAAASLPPLVPVIAVAISLAGFLAVVGVARRWRAVLQRGGE